MAYALIVEDAGAFADRREVRERFDSMLSKAGKTKGTPRGGMNLAAARRMAADAASYDAEITGGKPSQP